MKRVDGGYKLIEFFSTGWNSADAVVDVAAVEFRFGAVVLIKKLVFNEECCSELSKICPAILVQSICAKIRQLNSGLFDHLHQTKTLKLQQLIGP